MKKSAYLRDPMFAGGGLLYVVNCVVLKPLLPAAFLHCWFNDLLLIPCALPPLLLLHRWLGLRTHDDPPTPCEISAHLAVWALVCEYLGPSWLHRGTGDPRDVLAYAFGALAAALWWHRHTLRARAAITREPILPQLEFIPADQIKLSGTYVSNRLTKASHGAHQNPQAIEEVRHILKLHLPRGGGPKPRVASTP